MRCIAICQDELVIRTLHAVLQQNFDLEFLVESKPLARRLHENGINIWSGDPKRMDTYIKADLSPTTCVIIEDSGRRSPRKILDAVHDAGGTLVYMLGIGPQSAERGTEVQSEFPDITYLTLAELVAPTLQTELSRSV